MTVTRAMRNRRDQRGKAVEIKKIAMKIAIANAQGQLLETEQQRENVTDPDLGIDVNETEAVQTREKGLRAPTKIKIASIIEKGDMIRVVPVAWSPLDLTETRIEVDEVVQDLIPEKDIAMAIHPEVTEDKTMFYIIHTVLPPDDMKINYF